MRKSFLLLIPLLFFCNGCEFFDLEYKKVTYLLESQRRYVYESQLKELQVNKETRFLKRSDFNIPESAEIKKFKIRNIWLNVNPEDDNVCNHGFLGYAVSVNDYQTLYTNKFLINDLPFNNLLINNDFSDNLNSLRQKIEQAIINDHTIELGYLFRCEEKKYTHVVIIVSFTFDVEYINCEEVLSGTDLEDC